eukprot:CAMPEP_0201538226 /NCGR_PEP_ID=MMETSP0161_2-20130828/67015_1 /ASSEMBLY_ACC=CAM_ASM_000251 /TAXON_ID=180227 /ORGANISM="Neoparamoeba aestuarina, Strain SoJaBio B1-5/56/2" /LENGTH=126 /DNA_ID=CAMNT_0047944951 /DNA_START=330 /DNA_END=710 /DNA_ORIENTATION=+
MELCSEIFMHEALESSSVKHKHCGALQIHVFDRLKKLSPFNGCLLGDHGEESLVERRRKDQERLGVKQRHCFFQVVVSYVNLRSDRLKRVAKKSEDVSLINDPAKFVERVIHGKWGKEGVNERDIR